MSEGAGWTPWLRVRWFLGGVVRRELCRWVRVWAALRGREHPSVGALLCAARVGDLVAGPAARAAWFARWWAEGREVFADEADDEQDEYEGYEM